MVRACRLDLSVGRSVRRVHCGKTADWIGMPFGLVKGVGREMGALDGVDDKKSVSRRPKLTSRRQQVLRNVHQ